MVAVNDLDVLYFDIDFVFFLFMTWMLFKKIHTEESDATHL